MEAMVERITPTILISRLLFPLDSSGSKYRWRLIGIRLKNMKNWKPSWYSPRAKYPNTAPTRTLSR